MAMVLKTGLHGEGGPVDGEGEEWLARQTVGGTPSGSQTEGASCAKAHPDFQRCFFASVFTAVPLGILFRN